MAKLQSVCRTAVLACLVGGVAGGAAIVSAQPGASAVPGGAPASTAAAPVPASGGEPAASRPEAPPPQWIGVPRVAGRLTAEDIGLVINTADPYSVAVGEHYIERRGLKPAQVLRVELPVRGVLTLEEFEPLQRQIEAHFGDATQALALAWTVPYAVQCQSITGVLAMGFDPELCQRSCNRSRLSPYFNSPSVQPWRDLRFRPSMLLAGRDIAAGKRLIDRGVSSDSKLGRRWSLPANVVYLSTSDAARNVRSRVFPPAGPVKALGIDVHVEHADQPKDYDRLLLLQTGAAKLSGLDTLSWVEGALADHLTSFGGQLDRVNGQSTVLEWLDSGATASYGTVSEPCNHLQKFPHPQVLLLHYAQGSSAIEAYWKSVAWPQQGVFVGEPLAAPFGRAGLSVAPTAMRR